MAYKVTDFKVGDLVRVRDWDDMAKEFGFSDLYINVTCGCVFNPKMKVFCGQEFVITVIEEDSKGFWEIKGHNFNGWTITPEMIEPVNRETKEVKQMKNYSEAIEYMQQEKLKQTEPFQKFYDEAIEAMEQGKRANEKSKKKKFRVTQDLDYVMGHLRYGHKEMIIEADSLEEVKEMFADGDTSMMDIIVDDYSIDDYSGNDNPIKFEEVKQVDG